MFISLKYRLESFFTDMLAIKPFFLKFIIFIGILVFVPTYIIIQFYHPAILNMMADTGPWVISEPNFA